MKTMAMLLRVNADEENDDADIEIIFCSMIAADFATFAVLVSFGVLLGNNQPFYTLITLSTN